MIHAIMTLAKFNHISLFLFLYNTIEAIMSNFSIHKAALEGTPSSAARIWECTQRQIADRTGQPGLVRSILSEDPKSINTKDAVRYLFTYLLQQLVEL